MAHSRHEKRSRRVVFAKAALAAAALVIVLAAGYMGGRLLEEKKYPEIRGEMSAGFGEVPKVEIDGVTYEQKMDVTSLLMIGIDKASTDEIKGYRDGGQSDFLLLLVLDHKNKTIRQLQIDRDTMTSVNVLGLFGNNAGSRVMQICLSHGYGMDRQERCQNSLRAVEGLLNCPEIELYMEVPLDAISTLNDLLGGVTVTLEDDFTAADPAMTKGATLTLTGEQAVTLVRRRMDVADGTNETRMTRQREFMDAAVPLIREKINESSGFITTMIDTLTPYVTTNMVRGRMINEINRAYHYEVEPVQYLSGEHSIGEDGFVEFHADEQSIVDFVLDAFYTKNETALIRIWSEKQEDGSDEKVCSDARKRAACAERRERDGSCA